MKYVFLFASIFTSQTFASDLLRCETDQATLRVYSVGDAYGFSLESVAYERMGPIDRNTVDGQPDGRPAMTFSRDDVRIIHLFGEYAYFSRDGYASFPDESCTLQQSAR